MSDKPENHLDVGIARTIMRAIWGTNIRCELAEEQRAGEEILASAEEKVSNLFQSLDSRPARDVGEAMQQFTGRH